MELCFTYVKPSPPHLRRKLSHRQIKPTISLCIAPAPVSANQLRLAETLQNETLETLEWSSVCKQVSAFTSTTMGFAASQNGQLPLGRSPEESRKLLDQTAAAMALPRPLDFSGIEDVSQVVNSSASGELVSIRELCAVKRTLRSARELFEQLQKLALYDGSSERYLPLLEIFRCCNFLIELEQKIGYCIDCNFSIILDRASEDLEIIRSERKRNMENLDSLLKKVSAQIFQGGGIDRPLITKRRSRMCVGIRASHRSLLPDGVVLNVSSSGATYFMEPKEAVELNNLEVRLSNSEKVEEQTILSLLTSEVAESKLEIKYLLDKILELDLAFARAGHGQWMHGVCPNLISEGCGSKETDSSLLMDVEDIHHPLLLETSLRSSLDFTASKSSSSDPLNEGYGGMEFEMFSGSSDFPVPIDIKIGYGTKVVVISGPNTGGKTASMKTLGLASLMTKAGMYLPAKGQPRLPWFDLILADIGDHQSLEQNLSTFSGHIAQLCKILEVASKDSLVLIDEIGSGTDPSEGVALSASILQYLKDRVNLAVVTTHYADLTRLKERDTRFENAAMEFSLETLQPTYQIMWGSRGDSNALSVAKSIGFDDKVIERAKVWVEKLRPEKQQLRQSLLYQSLVGEKARLETQASRAASLHSDVMNIYHEIREEAEDLERREAALRAKETQRVKRELKDAKAQIEAIVREFENQLRTANADQFSSLIKKSESAIASVVEAHSPSDDLFVGEADESCYTPQIGERVHVKGLGNNLATVVEAPGVDDDAVLVQSGKIRVRVNKSRITAALQKSNTVAARNSLQRLKRKGPQQSRNSRNLRELRNGKEEEVAVSYGPAVQTSKNTVDLRGMRVAEASHHLNMAIGSRGPNSILYVIHGMGTGVVKECAIEILKNHPRVIKFEQGAAELDLAQKQKLSFHPSIQPTPPLIFCNNPRTIISWEAQNDDEVRSDSQTRPKFYWPYYYVTFFNRQTIRIHVATQEAASSAVKRPPSLSLSLSLSKRKYEDKNAELSHQHLLNITVTLLKILGCDTVLKLLKFLQRPRRKKKMLAVFEKSTGNPPEELSLPLKGVADLKTGEEVAEFFRSRWPDSTLYTLPKGNFLGLSHGDQSPLHPRSIVVVDDVFCIFNGMLENTCELRRHYGLSRQATEAMVVVEAYKVLRDRAPYPPDQVIRDLQGKFAFVLFDARENTLFLARDREGCVPFQWGVAGDGSLVCSDDPKFIKEACGKCYTPFPPGCIFMSGIGLISFDHPLHKVKGIAREDEEGNVCAVIFQVDLFTRLHSIPRTGSAANWAGATAVEGE